MWCFYKKYMNHEVSIHIGEQLTLPPMDFETIQNPWGPSPQLRENQDRVGPVSEENLIRHIGDWLSIDPRSVTLGANGSTEIINLIPKLFVRPDSNCVIVTPTYFGLYESLKSSGNPITAIQTHENAGFAYDDSVISHLFSVSAHLKPSLTWFCTPNNPTGVTLDPDVIDRFAQKNPETLVVVDEAYQEIVDPKNCRSMIRHIDNRPNILVTKTFSKAWGLPEIKIGIAIGHKSLIEKIKHHNGRPAIHAESLVLAEASLLDTDHLEETAKRMKSELAYVHTHISAMKHIKLGSQSETGVCIIRHDRIHIDDALKRVNIRSLNCDLVRDLEGLGYVRIGLQTHEKNMQLISRLWQLDSL